MKPTNKKLLLKKEHVKALTEQELEKAPGGTLNYWYAGFGIVGPVTGSVITGGYTAVSGGYQVG